MLYYGREPAKRAERARLPRSGGGGMPRDHIGVPADHEAARERVRGGRGIQPLPRLATVDRPDEAASGRVRASTGRVVRAGWMSPLLTSTGWMTRGRCRRPRRRHLPPRTGA